MKRSCCGVPQLFVKHVVSLLHTSKSAFQILRIMKHDRTAWSRSNCPLRELRRVQAPHPNPHNTVLPWDFEQPTRLSGVHSLVTWAQNLLRNITVVLLWVQSGAQSKPEISGNSRQF